MNIKKKKTAIVLLNLGGPAQISDVKRFLFNLFYDPAIIRLPRLLRFFIAKIIAFTREKQSKSVYSLIGGKSPILQETVLQENELTKALKNKNISDFKVFISMRHSEPKSENAVEEIKKYLPEEIILLPLYPQFSTTTTGSAVKDFMRSMSAASLMIPVKTVCCYSLESDFIKSHILLIVQSIKKLSNKLNFRILFSAHSLPISIIKSGDPYQWQIEQTIAKIVAGLDMKNIDYKICYQSKVGMVKWLTPSTESEIKIGCKEKKSLIIVPIAFVSDHVETLVELDIEYKKITQKYNVQYIRVPTLRINDLYINSLVNIVQNFLKNEQKTISASFNLDRICPSEFTKCICNI